MACREGRSVCTYHAGLRNTASGSKGVTSLGSKPDRQAGRALDASTVKKLFWWLETTGSEGDNAKRLKRNQGCVDRV